MLNKSNFCALEIYSSATRYNRYTVLAASTTKSLENKSRISKLLRKNPNFSSVVLTQELRQYSIEECHSHEIKGFEMNKRTKISY